MLRVADKVAPVTQFTNDISTNSKTIPIQIKRKMAMRRRMLSRLRANPDSELNKRLKNLNAEIRNHFATNKRKRVRKGIIPGNCKSLWKAVRIAKDLNSEDLPKSMFKNGHLLDTEDLAEEFANHFEDKISSLMSHVVIDQLVYNGERKLHCNEIID